MTVSRLVSAVRMASMRLGTLILSWALLCLLYGCEQRDSLAGIKARGELVVVVVNRNSPRHLTRERS